MRVIITGGAGLIGRALTKNLTADGYEVIILSRAPERVNNLPPGVSAVAWDGRTAAGWGHLADGVEAIVNLAGENLSSGWWTAGRKRRIRSSRFEAGQAVVEAVEMVSNKPKVVLQVSAVGYYGPHGNEPLHEDAQPGSDFLSSVCVDWEAATAPVEALGVRRVVARLGVVFSLAGGALPRMLLPFKWFVGGPLGSGRQWLSWIHLADAVAALRYLLEHQTATGSFNVTAPAPLTNTDFSRAVGRVLRRPAFIPVPALALRLALGEMSTLVLTGQRVLPQRLQQLGFTFQFPTAEAALRNLITGV